MRCVGSGNQYEGTGYVKYHTVGKHFSQPVESLSYAHEITLLMLVERYQIKTVGGNVVGR